MTKQAIDTDGITEISIPDSQAVKTVDGVNYVLTAAEQTALDDGVTAHNAAASTRETDTVRAKRDVLLAETDWTQLADCALTTQCIADFATYRQSLRDVPAQADIFNITWPTKPVEVLA